VKKTAGIILALTAILLSCESEWTTRVAGIDPDTRDIGELNTLLVAMDAQADAIVETVQEKGVLYQRLGIQYLEAQMIGPALDAFTEASYYYPESPGIQYYIGVSAAGMYANATNPNQRERLLAQAERAYRNALTLNYHRKPGPFTPWRPSCTLRKAGGRGGPGAPGPPAALRQRQPAG
jgi:hypothetical protein